jgi:CRISPR-associated protein Cmr2
MVYPAFEMPQEIRQMASQLGLKKRSIDLTTLPSHAFSIQFTFQLRRPYLSKGDVAFYVLDNPVRKDKVLGLPMVAPTQWKGALRSTMTYQLANWWLELDEAAQARRVNYRRFITERVGLVKLFGNEKRITMEGDQLDAYLDQVGGEKLAKLYRRYLRRFVAPTGFRAGRLRFFPTFFAEIGLEVINPHDRETRAGTQPIYFESVPDGEKGDFTLLYVPFDCIGREEERRRQMAADLQRLGKGIRAMLTQYGFGAKISSGFGVVQDRLVEPGLITPKMAGAQTDKFSSLTEMSKKMKRLADTLTPEEGV